MKRIYLYFKEKVEKKEFSSRGMRMFLFLGTRSFFHYLVFGTGYSGNLPVQLSMYADSSTFDVRICHVLTLVHGVWVSLRKLREAFRNRKVVIGVVAFAGLCFFGTLMLVENSTELLAQTVLPGERTPYGMGERIIR